MLFYVYVPEKAGKNRYNILKLWIVIKELSDDPAIHYSGVDATNYDSMKNAQNGFLSDKLVAHLTDHYDPTSNFESIAAVATEPFAADAKGSFAFISFVVRSTATWLPYSSLPAKSGVKAVVDQLHSSQSVI